MLFHFATQPGQEWSPMNINNIWTHPFPLSHFGYGSRLSAARIGERFIRLSSAGSTPKHVTTKLLILGPDDEKKNLYILSKFNKLSIIFSRQFNYWLFIDFCNCILLAILSFARR